MGKRELYIILGTVGIEAVAVGVGLMLSPTAGGIIAVGGVLFAVFFYWRAFKAKDTKKQLTAVELKALSLAIEKRIEERKEYLPELKKVLNEYINRVQYLANNSDELLEYEVYSNIYLNASLKAEGIKRQILSLTAVLYLYKEGVYKDNLAFRDIQDKDKELSEIKTRMNGLNAFVVDKIVRTNVKGYPEAVHIAYSYVVFNRFLRMYSEARPFVKKFYFDSSEKAMNKLRDLQNGTNKRIDELLEGAEDEL